MLGTGGCLAHRVGVGVRECMWPVIRRVIKRVRLGLEAPCHAAKENVHDVHGGVLHDIAQKVLGGEVGGEDAG